MYTVRRVLIFYSRRGHTDIVQFIVLSTDVDINCTDNDGDNTLEFVISLFNIMCNVTKM